MYFELGQITGTAAFEKLALMFDTDARRRSSPQMEPPIASRNPAPIGPQHQAPILQSRQPAPIGPSPSKPFVSPQSRFGPEPPQISSPQARFGPEPPPMPQTFPRPMMPPKPPPPRALLPAENPPGGWLAMREKYLGGALPPANGDLFGPGEIPRILEQIKNERLAREATMRSHRQ